MVVKLGVDAFVAQDDEYKQKNLALVTNHAAVTSAYQPVREALVAAGYKILRLFSPEHGLVAVGADGRSIADGTDRLTGLPVMSLYGSRLQPEADDIEGIDAVVVDLPNIGCRFYTYLWTLTYVMEACSRHNKELVILDRPNLISGSMELIEGPPLDEEHCASFIGRWAIPLRHSCTMAELARFWAASRISKLQLTVIPVEGWDRNSFSSDWSGSFVPTSPAIADAEAALLYPGLGLLEATNLSEGRGTATSFRVAGAPWLNASAITKQFNGMRLAGVVARTMQFTPESAKYSGAVCQGLMFHVTNRKCFRPVLSAMVLIKLIRDFHPRQFTWSRYPSKVNPDGEQHLDKLLGIPNASLLFEESMPRFLSCIHSVLDCREWKDTIRPFLLY